METETAVPVITELEKANASLRFPEIILQKMQENEKLIFNLSLSLKEEVFSRLIDSESSINFFQLKLNEINNFLDIYRVKIDKIDPLLEFEEDTKELTRELSLKLNSLTNEYYNSCSKYDKIVLENLIVPGTIGNGKNCTYKDLREYIIVTLFNFIKFITFYRMNFLIEK